MYRSVRSNHTNKHSSSSSKSRLNRSNTTKSSTSSLSILSTMARTTSTTSQVKKDPKSSMPSTSSSRRRTAVEKSIKIDAPDNTTTTPAKRRYLSKKSVDNDDNIDNIIVPGDVTPPLSPVSSTLSEEVSDSPVVRRRSSAKQLKEPTPEYSPQIELPALDADDIMMTTWNVAGFRGSIKNGIYDKLKTMPRVPDILCLQEVKIQQDDLEKLKPDQYAEPMAELGYQAIYNFGLRAGYAGVAIFYKNHLKPISSSVDSSFAYPSPFVKPSITNMFQKLAKKTTTTKKKQTRASDDDSDVSSDDTTTSNGDTEVLPGDDNSIITPAIDQTKKSNNTTSDQPMVGPTAEQIAYSRNITGDIITPEMRLDVWKTSIEEGRLLTADFGKFFMVTTYVPNSGDGLKRVDYRREVWEPVLLEYLLLLQQHKPVIYNGDLNVARENVDVHTPSTCCKYAGFTDKERERAYIMFDHDKTQLIDSFRQFQGDNVNGFTYWSHRFSGREKNRGWRIDYFVISKPLLPYIKGTAVGDERKIGQPGRISDHAPLHLVFQPNEFITPQQQSTQNTM